MSLSEPAQPHQFRPITRLQREHVRVVKGEHPVNKAHRQVSARIDIRHYIEIDPAQQEGVTTDIEDAAVHECKNCIIQKVYGNVRETGRDIRRMLVERLSPYLSMDDFQALGELIHKVETAGDELK